MDGPNKYTSAKHPGSLRDSFSDETLLQLGSLVVILIVGCAIRMVLLDRPAQYDESYTYARFASKPLSVLFTSYEVPNNQLLHSFFVHMFTVILGDGLRVIRLPALIFGLFLIPATYLVAKILYNNHAALLAAALVASSSALIEYSTNARGYTMICFFTMVSLIIAARLNYRETWGAWAMFIVISAMGFYTAPVMIFPFGTICLWILATIISDGTTHNIKNRIATLVLAILIIAVLTFLLYLPVVLNCGMHSILSNRFVMTQSWPFFVTNFPISIFSLWYYWNRDIPWILSQLLVAGFIISLIFHKNLSLYRVPILIAVVFWCIPVVFIKRAVPYERVWLFLLPLYFIFASAGISYPVKLLEQKFRYRFSLIPLVSIILCIFLTMIVYYSYPTYPMDLRDGEQIALFLKGYLKPHDTVLAIEPSDAPLEYYFIKYNIPLNYLNASIGPSNRVVLVINDSSPGIILDPARVSSNFQGSCVLLKRFSSSSLYEIAEK